jgi:hypothetical protein
VSFGKVRNIFCVRSQSTKSQHGQRNDGLTFNLRRMIIVNGPKSAHLNIGSVVGVPDTDL